MELSPTHLQRRRQSPGLRDVVLRYGHAVRGGKRLRTAADDSMRRADDDTK
jgi:hypothetical protein